MESGGNLRGRVDALETEVKLLRRDLNALMVRSEPAAKAVDARPTMTGIGDRGPGPTGPRKPPMASVMGPPRAAPPKRKSTGSDMSAASSSASKRPSLEVGRERSVVVSSSSSSSSGSSSSESSDDEEEVLTLIRGPYDDENEEERELALQPEFVRELIVNLRASVRQYETERRDRMFAVLGMSARLPGDYTRLPGAGRELERPRPASKKSSSSSSTAVTAGSSAKPPSSSGSSAKPSSSTGSSAKPSSSKGSGATREKSKKSSSRPREGRPDKTPPVMTTAAAVVAVSDEDEDAREPYAYEEAEDTDVPRPYPEGMSNGVQMANVVPLTSMHLCEINNMLKHTLKARKASGDNGTYLVVSNRCPSGCQMSNMLLNYKALEYMVSRLTMEGDGADRASRRALKSLDPAQRLMRLERYEGDVVPRKYVGYDKVFEVKDMRRASDGQSRSYLAVAVSRMGQAVFYNHEGAQLFEVPLTVLVPVMARLLLAYLFPLTTVYTHDPFAVTRDWSLHGNCTLYNPFLPSKVRGRDTKIFLEQVMPEQELQRRDVERHMKDWWNFRSPVPVTPVRDPRHSLDSIPYSDEARIYREAVLEPYVSPLGAR